jgi:hypothetical protein
MNITCLFIPEIAKREAISTVHAVRKYKTPKTGIEIIV